MAKDRDDQDPSGSVDDPRLLRLTLAARETELAAFAQRLAEADRAALAAGARTSQLEADLATRFRELAELGRLYLAAVDALADRDARLAQLQASTSWRITKPLRLFSDRLRAR